MMLLALFLCMERRKGAASRWAAYINTMPPQVPGGWAMRKEQQAGALRSLGTCLQVLPERPGIKQAYEYAQICVCCRSSQAHCPGQLATCWQNHRRPHRKALQSIRACAEDQPS